MTRTDEDMVVTDEEPPNAEPRTSTNALAALRDLGDSGTGRDGDRDGNARHRETS